MNLFTLLSHSNNACKAVLIILIVISTPTKVFSQVNTIGGDGGNHQNIYCPPNKYAVGISVLHNNSVIIKIKLLCSEVNSNSGSAVGRRIPTRLSTSSRVRSDSSLRRSTRNCPQGQFLNDGMRGYKGRVLAVYTVVSGLQVRCVRFSNINTRNGTSQRQVSGWHNVGAKFRGTRQTTGDFQFSTNTEIALSGLQIKRGYAVDSIRAKARVMPWYANRTQQNNTASPQVINRTVATSRPISNRRPDLNVTLQSGSDVWRYSGNASYRGVNYRQVSRVFCRTGMAQSSDAQGAVTRRKTFTLPAIQYSVVNSGNAPAATSTISEQFGQTTPRVIRQLEPGQRQNMTIVRRQPIQRCVVTGTGLPGCYECPRSSIYQDPILRITADSGNTLTESSEVNNVLQK